MTTSTCAEPTETMPGLVRVMVVDDHVQYRSLVGTVITAAAGFEFAGEAASRAEVIDALHTAATPPDLVLLDVNLGDDSGLEVSELILSLVPSVQIVLISTMARDELPPTVVECGARGFLPKSRVSPTALSEAWAGAYDW